MRGPVALFLLALDSSGRKSTPMRRLALCVAVVVVMFGHAEQVPALTFTGLIAYYTGDGDANDSSGNGNNGILENGATFAPGFIGQGFSLDGINDFQSHFCANQLRFSFFNVFGFCMFATNEIINKWRPNFCRRVDHLISFREMLAQLQMMPKTLHF